MDNRLTRRGFMGRTAAVAGTTVLATGLAGLLANTAEAAKNDPHDRRPGRPGRGQNPYGDLRPVADQDGVAWLALPVGFTYVTFSHTGAPMSDGSLTPQNHDGMRAFPGGTAGTRSALFATTRSPRASRRPRCRSLSPARRARATTHSPRAGP